MKQKLVMKVEMRDAKSRAKALKTTVGIPGVISASIEGADKNQIVVVGDGVDSVDLTKLLRRRMGRTELVSVAAADEKKEPEIAPVVAWPHQYYPVVPQPHLFGDPYPRNDGCSIM